MKNIKKNIEKSYTRHLLKHNEEPTSVFLFMEELGEEEKVFYDHFNSFSSIKTEIWGDIASETLEKIKSEEVYLQYSVREKLLSFYFTLLELLKNQRSFVVYCFEQHKPKSPSLSPSFLRTFREQFEDFMNELINEGMDTNEVKNRPVIGDRYADIVWYQLLLLIRFWIKDESNGFEQTDVAVEKNVNLVMDLLGETVFDSALDFAKFLLQKK